MKVIGLNANPRGKDSNILRLVKAVLAGSTTKINPPTSMTGTSGWAG
jgi:multimeric flavodoxin WrbA